jgi:hypothetical protein
VLDKTYVKDPIYPELLAIGRKDKTMRAEALEKHQHLRGSPEVLRRAGSETSRAQLAAYANQALRDAISSIPVRLTKEVAEAALCVKDAEDEDKDYEGLDISQRLQKMPGITLNIFKYQRGLAFKIIIDFLRRDIPPAGAIEKGDDSGTSKGAKTQDRRDSYRDDLEKLAQRAAALHYAGLGALFAYGFDEELRANNITIWSLDVAFPRTTLDDYLFMRYVDFVYGSNLNYIGFPPRRSKPLPTDVVELLFSLHQVIADGSPVGPHGLTEKQRLDLNAHKPFGLDSDVAREIYKTKWHPWCCGERSLGTTPRRGPGSKAHFVEMVTPITAASGLVVRTVAQHFRLNAPVHAEARLLTHKALANNYQFDEWTPILDGKSLRYRADTYFDIEGPLLTGRAIQ